MSALTSKQARFAEEYLIDLNATQAAIRAGYSKKAADTTGPRLLDDPRVVAAIDANRTVCSVSGHSVVQQAGGELRHLTHASDTGIHGDVNGDNVSGSKLLLCPPGLQRIDTAIAVRRKPR
ncbi:terminase small subunit [Sinorhizobium meliloti]|uniref:terminase small subunit n=1 Tax=Rhizobium meliloti TaxID=382 RepID=UPI00299D98E0